MAHTPHLTTFLTNTSTNKSRSPAPKHNVLPLLHRVRVSPMTWIEMPPKKSLTDLKKRHRSDDSEAHAPKLRRFLLFSRGQLMFGFGWTVP